MFDAFLLRGSCSPRIATQNLHRNGKLKGARWAHTCLFSALALLEMRVLVSRNN